MTISSIVNNNKKLYLNKVVRVNGIPAKIAGAGPKSLVLKFNMPKGFSTVDELTKGFVNWNNMTPDLREQLESIWNNRPQGQQRLV